MQKKTVGILGVGSYVPEKVVTNFDLEKIMDTSDEWIRTRTGISERRIAEDNIATSDLATEASKRALADANLKPKDIQLIVVASVTGDYKFPATACLVQNKLGVKDVVAFDINAACSGFIFGIEIARQFISTGKYSNALVIGAEKLSSIIDWEDRNVCVLLGDGAGACVLGEVDSGKGIIDTYLSVDGSRGDLLKVPAGGSALPASADTVKQHLHFMKMEGKEVFKHAVLVMCRSGLEVLKRCNMTVDDVDCIIPHQANLRIIEAIAKKLHIPMSKVYTNLDRYGNMSSASIPVALDEAVKNGAVKKGQKVLLVAFGAGFTWGSTVIQL